MLLALVLDAENFIPGASGNCKHRRLSTLLHA
jgi:hypothetical protein